MTKNRICDLFAVAMLAMTIVATTTVASAQTFSVLYNFGTNSGDPSNPQPSGIVAQGRDGNLYSTTPSGGNLGYGAMFKITPSGTLTVPYSFDSTDPSPISRLTLGTDGNFYGATQHGGASNVGTVFKVTPSGSLTVLYNFTGGSDGGSPYSPPIQGTDGNFYGTTSDYNIAGNGSVYKITPSGKFTTLYDFDGTHGCTPVAPLVQGTDGNFYGTAVEGGAGVGVVFKITPSGKLTVLYNFDNTHGQSPNSPLMQASDGNFYGTTSGGGTQNHGVIFKITAAGKLTVLHNLNGTTDGGSPEAGLAQATDGNFYGTTNLGGSSKNCSSGCGTIFRISPIKPYAYKVLYNFDSTTGANPQVTLLQHTNGILYGDTESGGTGSGNNGCTVGTCGVFYSVNIGATPFVSLVTTSGKVGSKIGILGQGFSKSSVVKFGGVQATQFKLTGTTFILATVPAGAVDGNVTVTTGATKLTSRQTFIVHDSWGSGAAMPTAVYHPATGVLNNQVYVVGGYTTAPTAVVQIYNPATNTWSAGVTLPTATSDAAAAVVNNVLYVIGDYTIAPTKAVWAYDPKTKTWSGKTAMPTARNGAVAVVEKNIIYVAGGYDGTNFLATVESYNPATDTWTEEAPMLGAKDDPAAGLIGTTIVVADGANAPGAVTGDTEGYNATTNTWTSLATDPTARTGSCSGPVGANLYDAGGYINNGGAATTVNESFSSSKNQWTTTLTPMPQGTMFGGSAVLNGQLYCFGGEATVNGNPINNVQIYQP